MDEPIWNQFLTERDKRVFAAAGYAERQGFGKRPALLIIDVNYNFCGDRPEPILDSIKRWRNSCGEDAWHAIGAIQKLLAACRTKRMPVFYTTDSRRPDNWDAGSWSWKSSRTRERNVTTGTKLSGYTIVSEIAPEPQDIMIQKQKPSAFFGTPIISYLTLLAVDSLIVTGTTTSGCVRATVVDAFSNNYRVSLVQEACFDRSQASHALSLCDMNAKYADVVTLDEAVHFIEALPSGLFQLPTGAGTAI